MNDELIAKLESGEGIYLGFSKGNLHYWPSAAFEAKSPWDDMRLEFHISEDDLEGANILLASYEMLDYEGMAFVLFEKDDVLYEVNASHCSCYGLEDQWNPEETSAKALRYRLDEGKEGQNYYGENIYAEELRVVLDWLEGGIDE